MSSQINTRIHPRGPDLHDGVCHDRKSRERSVCSLQNRLHTVFSRTDASARQCEVRVPREGRTRASHPPSAFFRQPVMKKQKIIPVLQAKLLLQEYWCHNLKNHQKLPLELRGELQCC